MIKSGAGRSNNADAFKAGAEAAKIAVEEVGNQANLIIVFSSVKYDQQQMLAGVRSVSKDIPLIGCSDSGEIVKEGPSTGQTAVMALSSDAIGFTIGVGKNVSKDSHKAGMMVAEEVKNQAKEPLTMFMMLPDGLTGDGTAIVRGVQDSLGTAFPIVGGSAGDDFAFKKTYQYYNDQVLTDSVVGVGFSGNFAWGVGVMHGWEPVGIPMKVTKSKGRVLEKLDGKPALEIYEDYFGKKTEELVKEPLARIAYTYPLGMNVKGSSELLLRDVVIADKKGRITCAAEIPQDAEVRLMIGGPEKAIAAAKKAAETAMTRLKGAKPKSIIIFDCIARWKLLGGQIGDEISAIQDILGSQVPMIGFYTYGEQASLGGRVCKTRACRAEFHNETVVVLVLGE